MTASHHPSDRIAAARMLAVEPRWSGIESAGQALGLDERILLHAGPAVSNPRTLTTPVLNSAVMAVLFEGWAQTPEAAEELVLSSQVRLEPAQDYYAVVPLADVLTHSMQVQVVADRLSPRCAAYSPLNGGTGPVMRLGLRNREVLEHLRWINGELAAVLARALDEPIPLIELADAGLAAGDDCHGRTPAATQALVAQLAPKLGRDDAARHCRTFLDTSPGFFLNLWMAATKCIMRAAEGTAGSSVVTAAAGNGAEFGIQLAGMPRRWFSAAATAPLVPAATPHIAERSLGAIGDSAVIDAWGLGGMALAYAPETARALAPVLAADANGLAQRLLAVEHPGFRKTHARVVLPARTVVACQAAPMISLGVLDRMGLEGRLAGGSYRPPVVLFEAACNALEPIR